MAMGCVRLLLKLVSFFSQMLSLDSSKNAGLESKLTESKSKFEKSCLFLMIFLSFLPSLLSFKNSESFLCYSDQCLAVLITEMHLVPEKVYVKVAEAVKTRVNATEILFL